MKLSTSVSFNGKTEEVFNFYKAIFGVEFSSPIVRKKTMFPDLDGSPEGERVLHVAMNLSKQELIGNDSPDAPTDFREMPQSFSLCIEVDTEEEGQRIFNALSEDGEIVLPLEMQPWGDYFGHVVDKFGMKWDVKIGQ